MPVTVPKTAGIVAVDMWRERADLAGVTGPTASAYTRLASRRMDRPNLDVVILTLHLAPRDPQHQLVFDLQQD